MSLKKGKFLKNYIYNMFYQILILIAPLVTTPYVSRILGAEGIGIYSYTQSIATYFTLVGAVGTSLYGQREIAYVQEDSERRTKVFWEITIFRFATVLVCTIMYFVIFGLSDQYTCVYRILTLEVFATAFDISWFFMGMENFKLVVIRNSVIKLIGIVLIFIMVKNEEDVPLYTLCLTAPIFIGNISMWFSLPKYLVRLHEPVLQGIPGHFKAILTLFFPQIAMEVYLVLDKTMIGLLATDIGQVGFYTQAQKIVRIVLLIVTSLGTVMLPAMSAVFAQGKMQEIKKNIKYAFRLVFMLAFALMFGICAVAKRFVPLFFGAGYAPVVSLIIVISPILVIVGISNVLGKQYLLPTKQQGAYTLSVVSGAVVNFILNFILIRYFNAVGASVATVFAELTVTLVQCWSVRKQLPLKEFFKPFFRYLILGMIMYIAVWKIGKVLPSGGLFLGILIIAGMAVYLLELVITRDEFLGLAINMISNTVRKRRDAGVLR